MGKVAVIPGNSLGLSGITIPQQNTAPYFPTSHAVLTLDERVEISDTLTVVYTFTASDVNGDSLTYSLSGADASSLTIDASTGAVTLNAPADYETKDQYVFTVTASDGSLFDTINVTLDITDVPEAPVISSSAIDFVEENLDITTAVYQTSASDGDNDALIYSLSGIDSPLLSIDASSGTVTLNAPANYEIKDQYLFTVTASDGSLTDTVDVTLDVTDVNEAPMLTTAASIEIDEDVISSAIPFEASDIDGDTLILTIGSATSGAVTDLGDGTYTYGPNADFHGSDSFIVSVTDGLETVERTVVVSVNPVNDLPTGELLYHGKFVEGQTISVDASQIGDRDGLGELSYRWSRDGQLVSDIDSQYYTLTASDLSSSLVATVTYTDTDGTLESVVGSPITAITPLGDFRSLSFEFLETTEELRLDVDVELSQTFSETNSIQLLYWKEGEDQTWITLTRESDGESFTYSESVNRFLSSGTYAIRQIRAFDNFGAEVRFTEEKLQELAVDTKVELVNSQSDDSGPSLDQFSIREFYYNDLDETWNIDYTIQVSDDLSGFQAGHIVEFTSPTGKSLQEWRYLESDGTLTTTRSFSKHIASGDYTINTIRLYDHAGNDGWVYGRDLSTLGLTSILSLDNPFGDEDLPELLNFNLEASFHPVSLRPSILFDFVAQDIGTGYKNAYIRISDSNGLNNDRWIDLDADPLASGIQFLLDLTSEYTPGRFTIDYFNLYDIAGNEKSFSASDLEASGYDSHLNVFFKPQNAANDFVISATNYDDWLIGSQENDSFDAGSGDDVIFSLGSSNLIKAGGGSDSISLVADSVWGAGYYANHASSIDSIGTGKNVSLNGKSRFADIIDGGSSNDIVYLTSNADAFFLDDHFSQVHPEAVANAGDYQERFTSIEKILGGSGDDILDCSSENYLLNQLHMELDGGSGNDILWAAQGDDTLNGGTGNDFLNGSSGNDTLTGGLGSDTFEFTATSGNDTITDFNKDEDELHFYFRKGEAEETAVASIENGVVTWDAVTVDLGNTSLAFSDLNITYEMI